MDWRWIIRQDRFRAGVAMALVVCGLLLAGDVAHALTDRSYNPTAFLVGVLIEAHGLLFDVVAFGVLLLALDLWREHRAGEDREKRDAEVQLGRWHEELEDFQGWMDSEESARRTAGLVRRVARAKAQVNAPFSNLQEAKLHGVDLTGADLNKGCLVGAELRDATLTEANLGRADLTGADLTKAVLTRADLQAADLCGAKMFGARLDGANLAAARGLDSAQLREAVRLVSDPPIRGWTLVNVQGDGDDAWGTLTRDDSHLR